MVTGQTIVALLPEVISTAFVILVLLVGAFAERNPGISAGLAALGTLAVFASAAVLLATGADEQKRLRLDRERPRERRPLLLPP